MRLLCVSRDQHSRKTPYMAQLTHPEDIPSQVPPGQFGYASLGRRESTTTTGVGLDKTQGRINFQRVLRTSEQNLSSVSVNSHVDEPMVVVPGPQVASDRLPAEVVEPLTSTLLLRPGDHL